MSGFHSIWPVRTACALCDCIERMYAMFVLYFQYIFMCQKGHSISLCWCEDGLFLYICLTWVTFNIFVPRAEKFFTFINQKGFDSLTFCNILELWKIGCHLYVVLKVYFSWINIFLTAKIKIKWCCLAAGQQFNVKAKHPPLSWTLYYICRCEVYTSDFITFYSFSALFISLFSHLLVLPASFILSSGLCTCSALCS